MFIRMEEYNKAIQITKILYHIKKILEKEHIL